MATAESTNPTAMSAPVARAAARPSIQVAAPSRREFLYYIWAASTLLALGETGAALIWFAFPRFKEGEFGGTFAFNPEELPSVGAAPTSVPAGRFHVTRTTEGLRALYGVCTHLGCLPKWVPTNNRFECPCHGSKFQLSGTWIEGPAPRHLDRFITTVTYADGSTAVTPTDGGPIPLDPEREITNIQIDTGARIIGQLHP
jgi:cytochrome b6-f complex iron-sulfur subunit